MVVCKGMDCKTVGEDRMNDGHYAAADRLIAYQLRRMRHFDLLLVCLSTAYGGYREQWQGRSYPMDI